MKFLTGFSRFLSVIFSPMLTATYGVALAMLLSYLCFSPLKARLIVTAVTFAATCAIPVIAIYTLHKSGAVKEPGLNNREDRPVPYLIATACYVGTAVYTRFVNAPMWLTMFLIGGALSLVVLTIVFVGFPLSIVMVRTAIVMIRLRAIVLVRPPLPVIMTGTVVLAGIPFAIIETVEPSIVRILPPAMPVMIFITMARAGRTIVRIMRIIIPTSPIMDACRRFTDKTHI